MASTEIAAQLTEAHRLAQAKLAVETTARMSRIWGALDLSAIDATTERWMSLALEVIQGQRHVSASLSAQYLRFFRALELGISPTVIPELVTGFDLAALQTSLRVTGPVTLKKSIGAGQALDTASRVAFISSAGAASRHALNGGRGTIEEAATTDQQCVGWARVTDGHPCAFCAMLASRGPVYKTQVSATSVVGRRGFAPETRGIKLRADGTRSRQGFGESKIRPRGTLKLGSRYHDHCSCTQEPIYSSDRSEWPPRSREFADIWAESTQGRTGKQAINAFRHAYES